MAFRPVQEATTPHIGRMRALALTVPALAVLPPALAPEFRQLLGPEELPETARALHIRRARRLTAMP